MREDYNKYCELCKTPVRVEGNTTQYYVSIYDEIVKAHDELVIIIKPMQKLCAELQEQNNIMRLALQWNAGTIHYPAKALEALEKCSPIEEKE